jgi:tryptophan halogenase
LLANLPTEALGEPRFLKFSTGHRRTFWHKNVVALGLAGGFIEPLESTSIHLVQTAIEKLLNLFPDRGFRQTDIEFFNRVTATEFENVRDFLIAHYWANARSEPFWLERRALKLPDRLHERIDLYRGYGRIFRSEDELFSPVSWTAVLEGQGVHAAAVDPMAFGTPIETLSDTLERMRVIMDRWVNTMPSHAEYIARVGAVAAQTAPMRTIE